MFAIAINLTCSNTLIDLRRRTSHDSSTWLVSSTKRSCDAIYVIAPAFHCSCGEYGYVSEAFQPLHMLWRTSTYSQNRLYDFYCECTIGCSSNLIRQIYRTKTTLTAAKQRGGKYPEASQRAHSTLTRYTHTKNGPHRPAT